MKKAFLLFLSLLLVSASAAAEGGTVIVSMGDSYSSGEGNEPFYGQDAEMAVKCLNEDWVAHRSEKNWPGTLTLPAVDGPMKDHRGTNWFFTASSGALTENLFRITPEEAEAGLTAAQIREYSRDGLAGDGVVPPQLDIFDELDRQGIRADYVTVTIGGNDIGFQRIVSLTMAGAAAYLPGETTEEKADYLWRIRYTANGVRAKIKRVFTDVAARAGSQARVIVCGYPRPLAPEGGGQFQAENARILNAAAGMFNAELRDIAEECRGEGLNICFVSVEEAFDGHGAYSEDPYILPVTFGANPQDLKTVMPASYYSMHPNEKGMAAYARCVQAVIDAMEAERTAAP